MARSLCVYGPTGSWKTAQVKWFSHYIAQVTGKATLLLSTDGGGWDPCKREVEVGMIRPYRCDSSTAPLPILQLISKGYWPDDPENVKAFRPIDWTQVGGIAVEGWSSISQVIMRYLPASGISVGGEDRNKLGGWVQDVVVQGADGKEHSLNLNFRSNTRGDFGFVQSQLYSIVSNFNCLPCHAVMYTALESKSEDEDRNTTYGPAIEGKKATARCGSWVGDLIHAQDYAVARTVRVPDPQKPGEMVDSQVVDMSVRYYFKKHLDPVTMIPFPAKSRVPPEGVKELDRLLPGGYFEPTLEWGIDRYLATTDQLGATKDDDALRQWRERADAKLGRGQQAAGAK